MDYFTRLYDIYTQPLYYTLPISTILGVLDGAILSTYVTNHGYTSSTFVNMLGGGVWGYVMGYLYPIWIPISVYNYVYNRNKFIEK